MAINTDKIGSGTGTSTARAEAELPIDANLTKEQHRKIMSFMVEVGDSVDLEEFPSLFRAVQDLPETHRDLILGRYANHGVAAEAVDRILDFFGTVQLSEGLVNPLDGKEYTAYTGKVHIHTSDDLGETWRDSHGTTFLAHICGDTTQVVVPGKLVQGWTVHSADEQAMPASKERCIIQ